MKKGARIFGRHVLRHYEWRNFSLLVSVSLALVGFVVVVFLVYGGRPASQGPTLTAYSDITQEIVFAESNMCIFYLATEISEESKRYHDAGDISGHQAALLARLFAVPGVMEVQINPRSVVLYKTPSGDWDEIQTYAREILTLHLRGR